MKTLARALICAVLALHGLLASAAEVPELRIPKGAGGIAFLPLLVMEKQKSIEKHAAELGHAGLKVAYVNLGGAAVAIDALLSGATHLHAAAVVSVLVGPHSRHHGRHGYCRDDVAARVSEYDQPQHQVAA